MMEVVTRGYLGEQADAIRVELDEAGRNIVSVGLRLIEVKERIGHGQFEGWIKEEFGWTPRTAQKMMSVARTFPELKSANVFAFDKAALFLLSAPSTPEAARDEAKARASNGRVSHREAKEIVAQYKPMPTPAVQEDRHEIHAPVPTGPLAVPPTWEVVFASLSEFNKKQLGSPHVIKNAARNLYLTTLGLCGYEGVK